MWMRVLAFWDVFWKVWRKALLQEIWNLKSEYKPDFVIVNGENMSSWRGPIEKHMNLVHNIGVDLFTSWDHCFDNIKNLLPYLERDDCKMIRPANYYESKHYKLPGKGYAILEKDGKKLLVINVLSETFTRDHVYNPFLKVDEIVSQFEESGEKYDGIVVDFHKEVASEWYWMAELMEGRVSFIFGTHTHIQTNDDTIFENGTWLLSDVWMIGSKNSVIWSDFRSLKKRFVTWIQTWKIEQSLDRNYIINWVCFDLDDEWKCISIEKIKKTGILIS